jgi:hypothetical protein
MINILVIEKPEMNAVTWWRFLRPLAEMQKQNPGKFNVRMTRRLDEAELYFVDVVILSRPNDPETLQFAHTVKNLGRAKMIIDIDDAITNLPFYHAQYAYHNARKHIAHQIFELVDYFWVSTEQLLYECDCLGRGEIMPNAVLPEDLPNEPSPDRGLWMWRGNEMQKEDVYQAGVDVYDQVRDKASKWIFWGVIPNINHDWSKLLNIERELRIHDYFAKVKHLQLNGVWKPLVPCLFNDAKSNIAWIEATVSGGVCLTNYAGKTAWENAVSDMPTYEEARQVWAMSKERVLKDFNLVDGAKLRARSIEKLLNG